MTVECRGKAWSEPPVSVGTGSVDRRRVHGTSVFVELPGARACFCGRARNAIASPGSAGAS